MATVLALVLHEAWRLSGESEAVELLGAALPSSPYPAGPRRTGLAARRGLVFVYSSWGQASYAATAGKATGLRCPLLSTARMPNWTLSLEMSRSTVVTSPTLMAPVQSAEVVSRMTTS
jgi:hypothetical protein